MPKEFLLPELAESVVEGEIVKWLVAEGDRVAEDQPIVEVMTDKVTVELPSPFAGVLEKQLAKEGEVVAVHHPIARFADSNGATKPAQAEPPAPSRDVDETAETDEEDDGDALSLFKASTDADDAPIEVRRRAEASTPTTGERATGAFGRPLAVPAARKLARELDVDIGEVPGSGPNGRVRVEDVRQYAESAPSSPPAPTAPTPERTPYTTPKGFEGLEQRTPLRGLRRAISAQMVASHLQTVRTLHVDEADLTELVALRSRLKPLAAERQVKLSYLPFIMKATVAALKRFPTLNSSLDENAGEIVTKRYYNLGMAVATEAGLVVPVIKDVDRKSILEIAGDISTLAERAKNGKLASDDVKGGTFSITNIGSLGGLFSFPIINVPEAAILGVHSIKKRPVVLPDDSIVARQMIYLSLSFDHRLVDGAEAAMFTGALIELLEQPERLMLEG